MIITRRRFQRSAQTPEKGEMKKAVIQEGLKKDKSEEADQAAINEMCTFMRVQIDYAFGAGTSQKAFVDTASMKMIKAFLEIRRVSSFQISSTSRD